MTREEAKIILTAARPGGLDDHDPQVIEALAALKNDPGLAAWRQRERECDLVIAAKLREGLTCPPELKERLLASRRSIRPQVRWRQPAWLAAAACLLALAVAACAWAAVEWPRHYSEFESDMLARSAQAAGPSVILASDYSTAAKLLAGRGANTNLVLPPGLEGRPLAGSSSFRWKLHRVTAFRFKMPGNNLCDLYILEKPRFNDILHNCIPDFSAAGGFSTAHYYGNLNEYYLLVAPPAADLEKLYPK